MAKPNARQRPNAPPDLHGNAPDKCEVALLLVDVINDFEFPTANELWKFARPAVRGLAEVKQRAVRAGVPCIYANDNFGRWRSDFNSLVKHVKTSGGPGAELAKLLAPSDQDYFVLKVKQSAFYQTCLGLLLEHLGVQKLVIGGVATDNCVNMTANDAYLRGFELFVLRDGSAADDKEAHKAALAQMTRVLKAHTPRCADVSFRRSARGATIALRGGRAKRS
jgi:nicotinamidase-related amidase